MEFSNPITLFGSAYSRHGDRPFGMKLRDRLHHLYIIGQTGTGKSTLLRNLARQDAVLGTGFCLIDPHGDLAEDLAAQLEGISTAPVFHWRLADPNCPYGYNPLAYVAAEFRPLVTSGLIEALRKQWEDAWGVRMEHLLRFATLALLDRPGSTLQDILPMFLDTKFRAEVLHHVRDPQIRHFWTVEYPSMNYKTTTDGLAPIANKLGAFLAHPLIRRAVCEPAEPLRFRRIMDEGGILIVDLAAGRVGADNANVLGGLIVSNMMNAAFSRYSLPEAERRSFLLYVDEFHAFTTSAFAGMLSEVRKYGVGVTLAHQYILQADREIFEAIMGNVGSLFTFRIGAIDAPLISTQFHGVGERDLTALGNHAGFAQIMVDGVRTKAFSVRTWG